MNKISDKVLKNITDHKIHQLPTWYHTLQAIFLWGFCLLSILFGSLSLAYVGFMFFLADIPNDLLFEAFSRAIWIPASWFVLFLLFIGFAIWGVEQTKGAHRVHMSIWIAGNIIVTLVCTGLIFLSGVPHHWEKLLYKTMPEITATRLSQRIWEQPKQGMLQGRIGTLEKQKILLETREGDTWTVYLEKLEDKHQKLEEGLDIRVLGRNLGENQIDARRILPIAPKMRPFILPPRGEVEGRADLRFGR